MASQAKNQVNQLVSKQKDQAAERLGGFAGALRDAAGKLEGEEGVGLGRYAGQAAEQVEPLLQLPAPGRPDRIRPGCRISPGAIRTCSSAACSSPA